MSELRVAHRYSRSLFDLAKDQNKIQEVHGDMNLFLQACREQRELHLLLKNPIIQPLKKLTIIEKIFSDKLGTLALEFIRLVIKKNREPYLMLIAEEFHKHYNDHNGIEPATLTTPVSLDKNLKNEFIQFIKAINNKQIELTEEVDPELVGGFVVRTRDQRIDASLRSKLAKVKREITDQSFQKSI